MFTTIAVIGVFFFCIYMLARYITVRENAYYNAFPNDPVPGDYLTEEEWEAEQHDAQYPEY